MSALTQLMLKFYHTNKQKAKVDGSNNTSNTAIIPACNCASYRKQLRKSLTKTLLSCFH